MGPGITLLGLLLVSTTGAPPGASPALIDPLDPAAGDFLDIDLAPYLELGLGSVEEGEYALAARYFLAYLTRHSGSHAVIYSLACCYGLLGEPELASLYLRRAVAAGFYDLELVRTDPDFDRVRGHPAFEEAVDWLETVVAAPPDYAGELLVVECVSPIPCLYRAPDDRDLSGGVPLVIGLHGYGDSPENFIRLWEFFEDPGFVLACPRGPYAVSVQGTLGWSWFAPPDARDGGPGTDGLAIELLSASIDSLRARFHVSRVVLLGFSQGCSLAWQAGLEQPDRFDGIAGLGGRLDPAWIEGSPPVPEDGLPVFVANGTQDGSAPAAEGESAAAVLAEHGCTVTLRTWDGEHRLYGGILREVQRWIEEITAGGR